jgi:hypothetical protein
MLAPYPEAPHRLRHARTGRTSTMHRAVLVALLLAVLAPQAAAAPQGAPRSIGTSSPADHADHPGAMHEWWSVRLVDPRSRAWLDVTVDRELDVRGVRVIGVNAANQWVDDGFGTPDIAADRSSLDAVGPDGRLAIRRRGARIALESTAVTGALELRNVRRGPAARGWRLGEGFAIGGAGYRPVTLDGWSMPIATAKARGSLVVRGTPFDVRGWRASYQHGWGDMLVGDRAWEFWDQLVVHASRGVTYVAYGLNRLDTVTGPGARDAQWLGLLARVGPRGVRVCRPRVDRRKWALLYPELTRYATRLRFRCQGLRLRTGDAQTMNIAEYVTHAEVRGRTRGRRPGFAMHLAHPLR